MDNIKLNDKYNFIMHTFGCKVNTYDTGLIQKNLITNKALNLNLDQKKPIHVLNTCAVTSEATQQAVRLIRKIKSSEPLATVVVTGCAAQVDTDIFEKLPGADLVVANSHKGLLPKIIDEYFNGEQKQRVFKSNIFKKEDLEIGGGKEEKHTRSFLKIQDGCNSFCSFCIIPYARGKSRSISILELVKAINELEQTGLQEVVLTGVHIGDYDDQGHKIEDLVESIILKTNIKRIRLSSLEPIELSERLINLYTDDRLCPHFHMSIQSANTTVLKNMKRNYTESDVRNALLLIDKKVKNAFVGMDVIAGFPTETQDDFESTYKTLSELPWTKLHVFPYSERNGTRAAIMDQLPMSVRKERAQQLRLLSAHRHQAEALKQVGALKKTLVLGKFHQANQSLSRDYWPINLNLSEKDQELFKNKELTVRVKSVDIHNSEPILVAERFVL